MFAARPIAATSIAAMARNLDDFIFKRFSLFNAKLRHLGTANFRNFSRMTASGDDDDDDINLRPRDLPKGIRTC
jgi:hypothetical protein